MTEATQTEVKRNPFTPEMRAKAAATRARNKEKREAAAAKKEAKAVTPPPAKKPDEFAGLTDLDCCDGCDQGAGDRNVCVISGRPYCAHPFKGGLHATQKVNQDAMKRFNAAKSILKDSRLNPDKIGR